MHSVGLTHTMPPMTPAETLKYVRRSRYVQIVILRRVVSVGYVQLPKVGSAYDTARKRLRLPQAWKQNAHQQGKYCHDDQKFD